MERFRKDLGDLTELKKSIQEIGLIHPIVIDSKGELIAGGRRLKACQELGIKPVYRVVDFSNPTKAEIDENVVRKDFLPSEIFAIQEYQNKIESKQFTNHHNVVVTNCNDKKPIEQTAKITGKSVPTVSKINTIFKSDNEDLKKKVDEGMSVDKAYRKIKQDNKIEQIKSKSEDYEPENNIKIIEGDLFETINQIPDNSIDLLCTDPPYKILDKNWDDFNNLDDFMLFTENWLRLVMPKIKKTGRVYISFAQWYQYAFYEILKMNNSFGFNFTQNIIWYYKNNNKPSNRKEYRYAYEPIFYLYGEEAPNLNFNYETYGEIQNNVWEIATPQSNFNEGKYHPAQKPLELYRRIIMTGSFEGDTVLDCFAGSGTTGIVCKELNRKCILIEKDSDNIKLIKGRL